MECYRLYGEVVLVSVARKRKNKYGLFHIFFSSINNFGRVVILGIALTNIKVKQGYEWIFRQFAERVTLLGYDLPKTLITNADPELMEAATSVFTTSGHLINQNYVL